MIGSFDAVEQYLGFKLRLEHNTWKRQFIFRNKRGTYSCIVDNRMSKLLSFNEILSYVKADYEVWKRS